MVGQPFLMETAHFYMRITTDLNMKEMTEITTFRDLKTFCDALSEAQLDVAASVISEDGRYSALSIGFAEEDWVQDEEVLYPKSYYIKESGSDDISHTRVAFKAGAPLLAVD